MFIAATRSAFDIDVRDPAEYRGQFSGQLWRFTLPDTLIAETKDRIFLPPGVATSGKRPSGANYGNRQYLVGGHSQNLVIDEDLRAWRQSMPAPNTMPSVSVGAGTTNQIAYLRFFDEVTGERSPLSDGKVLTGNTTRTWSNLPTQVPNEVVKIEGTTTFAAGTLTGVKSNYGDLRPGDRIAVTGALTRWAAIRSIASQLSMVVDDTGMAGAAVTLVARPYSRATHVELWVSVAGALPRLVMRVRIGTPSVVESTATLAFGIAETTSFEAMPVGEFSVFYNDRQIVAGVEGRRDTVYLSAVGFPERHEGLRFVTAYNEPIVGLLKYRDIVIILCPESSYKLQGYTDEDYVRTVLEPDIGGSGHHGNKVVFGRAFIPGRDGTQIFNGAFHEAMPKRVTEWQRKYKEDRIAFEEGFAVVNRDDKTYQFYPRPEWLSRTVGAAPGETEPVYSPAVKQDACWVAHYAGIGPGDGGAMLAPEWVSDTIDTPDGGVAEAGWGYATSAAYLTRPGDKVGVLCRGNSLGKIWVEEESTFIGDAVAATGSVSFGYTGGNEREGQELLRGWLYCRMVTGTGTSRFRVWPGDERAYPPDTLSGGGANLVTPEFNGEILPHDLTGMIGADTIVYQDQITRPYIIGRSGRRFVFEVRFTNPAFGTEFYGLGGVIGPGEVTRPIFSRTAAGG